MRVTAQQLGSNRHTGCGATAVQQLGHDAGKNALGQQLIGDADELAHADINAAHAGDDVTQTVVQQAFHRREVNALV